MRRRVAALTTMIAVAVVGSVSNAWAQATEAAPALTVQDQAIRLYIQCDNAPCDQEFFRTELTWVNHVRDRQDADVHVLITSQQSGGGGRQLTLDFIGLRAYEGQEAQLRYDAVPNETQDATRRGILRLLQVGLVPYAITTPLARELSVIHSPPARDSGQPATLDVHDPWDFWVYRLRVGGNFNGESTSKNSSVNGSISANRTTEDWKQSYNSNINYSERTFTLSSGSQFTSVSRNMNANGLVAKSLGPKWSAAIRGSASSDTFVNQDSKVELGGGVEWNVFPYAESTRRQFTFQYTVAYNRFDYDQETLFGKLEETLFDQQFVIFLDMAQPWGSTNMSFEAANYWSDFKKYHVRVNGNADFRITRGLSLNVNGNVSRVRDQVYLPRGDASDEEILVRQRQLATSYRYGFSFGVSYTFGSIYNNVVNSRFRSN